MGMKEVADELYGLEPGEFTAARNTAAGGESDKALAKQIRALRKPSASAAAINALVRRQPDLIESVLEVGDRMRDAFAARDRDAIRTLTGDRQRLLQKATKAVGGASATVQREIEETLQAAVIDPAAAAAVRSGFLLRALESTGVDQMEVGDAVALPVEVGDVRPLSDSAGGHGRVGGHAGPGGQPAKSGPGKKRPAAEAPGESAAERRERERSIRTAEKAVERARAAADTLDDELDEEVDRRSDLEAERDDLSRRLERVQAELSEARAAERELRRRITPAQAALRDAEKALRRLRD
ncbi:hypothetical protein ACFVWR_05700 [Leifsonia sp. NPDC058292]|uniref:hypothetical protein n=1 Tax=Leifsonia sp. NPDC058292 TaxID=3346428 RepID=UPI0036DCE402